MSPTKSDPIVRIRGAQLLQGFTAGLPIVPPLRGVSFYSTRLFRVFIYLFVKRSNPAYSLYTSFLHRESFYVPCLWIRIKINRIEFSIRIFLIPRYSINMMINARENINSKKKKNDILRSTAPSINEKIRRYIKFDIFVANFSDRTISYNTLTHHRRNG